jgi:hypothetical protein
MDPESDMRAETLGRPIQKLSQPISSKIPNPISKDPGDDSSCELAAVTGPSSDAPPVTHPWDVVQPGTRKSSRLVGSKVPKPTIEEVGEDFSSEIAAVTGSSSDEDSVAPPLALTRSKITIAHRSASTENHQQNNLNKKPASLFQFPDASIALSSNLRLKSFGIDLLSTVGRTRVWSKIGGE